MKMQIKTKITRAQLNAAIANGTFAIPDDEIFLISDEDRLAIGKSPFGFQAVLNQNVTVLKEDVANNNAVANTLQDVTGLSFPVVAGQTIYFRFFIRYTVAAIATGSRWTINGPASPTVLTYNSRYSLTGSTQTLNTAVQAYDSPASANASSSSSLAGGNIAEIEGLIVPSVNGSVIARFASELADTAVTARTGSFVEWRVLP
jgi:hypothetical protein